MNCFGSRKKNTYTVNEEVIVEEESRVKGKQNKQEQDGTRVEEPNGDNKEKDENDAESDRTNDEIQSKNVSKNDKAADKKKDKKSKKKDDDVSELLENPDKSDNKKKDKKEKKEKKKDEVVTVDKKKDKKSNKNEKDGKNQKAKKGKGKSSAEDVSAETAEQSKQQVGLITTEFASDQVESIEANTADPDGNVVPTDQQELTTEGCEFQTEAHELRTETHELNSEAHELHSEAHEFNSEAHDFNDDSHQIPPETDEFGAKIRDLPVAEDDFGFLAEEQSARGNDDSEAGQITGKDLDKSEHRASFLQEQDLSDANRCGSSTPPPEDQVPADQGQDVIGNPDQRRFSSDRDSVKAEVAFDDE